MQQNHTASHLQAWLIGFVFLALAVPMTIWDATMHFLHYNKVA